MPVTKASLPSGGEKRKSLSDLHLHCCKLEPERSVYLTLPDCSMDRASRDTEIFSSEVLIQSNMPLQPFRGNVKFELAVVGRLWMLSTEKHRKESTSSRAISCKGHRPVIDRMSPLLRQNKYNTSVNSHIFSDIFAAKFV